MLSNETEWPAMITVPQQEVDTENQPTEKGRISI